MSILRAAFVSFLLLQSTWAIPASDSSAAVPTTTSKSVGVDFGSGSALPDATSVTILPSGTGTPNQQQQPQGRPGPPSIPPRLVPPAVQSVCDGDPGIPRSVRTLFQTGVTVTAGDCPPSNNTDSASFALKARRRFSALEPRGGCNFAGQGSSTCAQHGGGGFLGFPRCGAQCDSACYEGFNGPDPNDCEVIFNSFRSRPDQILTLAHGKFLLYTFKSCGTGIQNQIEADSSICASNMIYDYQDWAGVGSFLAKDCQAFKQPQGARGGKCLASANDWYIQVYKNE